LPARNYKTMRITAPLTARRLAARPRAVAARAVTTGPATLTLHVDGMVCSKCSDRVAAALRAADGVAAASADHAANKATVDVAAGASVDADVLAATVTALGLTPRPSE
jgi:P-type Cu+ transporter